MFLNYMSGLSKASLDCFSIWKIGVVGPHGFVVRIQRVTIFGSFWS